MLQEGCGDIFEAIDPIAVYEPFELHYVLCYPDGPTHLKQEVIMV
jgi:hypothetical protein